MSRFFLSAQDLARYLGATLVGEKEHLIYGVGSLETASPEELSLYSGDLYKNKLLQTKSKLLLVPKDFAPPSSLKDRSFLFHPDPLEAFRRALLLFDPTDYSSGFTGIHPTAVIHPCAILGKDLSIGPYVTIDRGVTIGDRSRLDAGTVIYPYVRIGSDCLLYANVVVREGSILGDRVIIQPGAVIGSCGFGYRISAEGEIEKLPQLGKVHIEEDVEIGANSTIDRAHFIKTVIGAGSKLDNLVHIAHNVLLGKKVCMAAQSGIAGSTIVGNAVQIGGQAGIAGHLEIPAFCRIAAQAGVASSIKEAGDYAGSPSLPSQQQHRCWVYFKRLDRLFKKKADS